jgi:hypothetical protein
MTARLLTTTLLALASSASAQSLGGLWDAAITVNGHEIPFRMEFSGHAPAVSGSFFNGEEKITSTSGRVQNGDLLLTFDYYGAKLQATLKDGALTGAYIRGARSLPFQAKPFVPSAGGATVGRRGVGGHSARRRRHRVAERSLSKRQVRAESL